MDRYGRNRWVDVSSGGPESVHWWIEKDDWVHVSQTNGSLTGDGKKDVRVYVSIDWDYLDTLEEKPNEARIAFKSSDSANTNVTIPLSYARSPPSSFKGTVEGDGYVAIEAAHHTAISRSLAGPTSEWAEITYFGRTHSGMTLLPPCRQSFDLDASPTLTYSIWFTTLPPSHIKITLYLSPALNLVNGKRLAIGVSVDDSDPVAVYPVPESKAGTLPSDWETVVSDEIRLVDVTLKLDKREDGAHEIVLWGMTSGVVVERVVVDLGGVKARGHSYLGPPESLIM